MIALKPADCICKVDKLGRILIPKNLRKRFNLITDDPIEVFTDGDSIILKKYRDRCAVCGSEDDLQPFKDKFICVSCLDEIKNS